MENTPTLELDPDFKFITLPERNAQPERPTPSGRHIDKLTPREKTFYARLGAITLAIALSTTPVITKNRPAKIASPRMEFTDVDFEPAPANALPAMELTTVFTHSSPEIEELEPVTPEELDNPLPNTTTQAASELTQTANDLALGEPTSETPTPATEKSTSAWDGQVLNAHNGHIDGPTGDETYYNLPMDEIVARMHRQGVEGDYWVREDGVKMLGDYVMVAANLKIHPRGSIVETSLGPGIVCDTGGFAKDHPNRLDIATNW